MTQRWVLGRAGITNVYQYGDEVLDFAGGRLLLRGVNGSGKSTAMNMLLPWLLDGDTRRIDAAGEQSGMLKSWMLTGRDDPQPVGYLWLELERGDDHVCFGCGIKANRASDTVTTWWWVTSRRPGIDLSLVEDNRPFTADALRAELGGDPVFRHDQRAAYREEIRNRLFGGADLDSHIRLLHIVRSPRVGDRVDVDLPAHLHDALPQVSDAALADAAQPLDELEEHRRNVTELRRTATTLDALVAVYADYARAELRRRAGEASELAADAERARREAARAERVAAERDGQAAATATTVTDLTGTEERLRSELAGLKEAPTYRAGRDLEDLRALVGRLGRAVSEAEERLAERDRELASAGGELREASAAAGADHERIARLLQDLTAAVVDVGLPVAAPDLPALDIEPLDPAGSLDAPGGRPAVEALRVRLEALRAAVVHRRGDLEEVRRELGSVDAAETHLARAGHELEAAEKDAAFRHEAHAERARRLGEAGAEWLAAVH